MRIGVIGSRTFKDKALLFRTLDEVGEKPLVIISGGAPGADRFAEEYAEQRNLNKQIFKANWNDVTQPDSVIRYKFGRQYDANAGFRRNKIIVDNSDIIIAFWDGKSPGTKNTLEYAKSIGKSINVFHFSPIIKNPKLNI